MTISNESTSEYLKQILREDIKRARIPESQLDKLNSVMSLQPLEQARITYDQIIEAQKNAAIHLQNIVKVHNDALNFAKQNMEDSFYMANQAIKRIAEYSPLRSELFQHPIDQIENIRSSLISPAKALTEAMKMYKLSATAISVDIAENTNKIKQLASEAIGDYGERLTDFQRINQQALASTYTALSYAIGNDSFRDLLHDANYALEENRKGNSTSKENEQHSIFDEQKRLVEKVCSLECEIHELSAKIAKSDPKFNIYFFLLLNIIIPHINSLLTIMYTPKIQQALEQSPSKKNFNEVIQQQAPLIFANNSFRFISKNNLKLRLKPSIKAKVIATLPRGGLVQIIHKNMNWTKIEYSNNGCIIQGWTNTRYLGKFK